MRPVPATMSKSQKFDLSTMSGKNRHFASQCLGDLHSKQRKNEQYWASQNTLHVKRHSSQNGQY